MMMMMPRYYSVLKKMKLVEKTKKIINNRPPYKQYKCDYLYIGKNHSNLIVYFIK